MSSLYFDPNDSTVITRLAALQPQPGYCVVTDIVGSTALKDRGLQRWAPAIFNTFGNVRAFLPPQAMPLKSLGDALMFFIPASLLSGRTTGSLAVNIPDGEALEIFTALVSSVRDPDPVYEQLKVAVAYCTDAYPLTFVKGFEDVYGKDIDLTFRLLSCAHPREVVMNEAFAQRVNATYAQIGNQAEFPEVPRIVGPWPEHFKGFKTTMPIYKLPAP